MLPWEQTGSKVQAWHRDRLAVVYVRQSTRQQVAEHGESTRVQYGLAGRATALGWAPDRVLVIDEDLGRSAGSAVGRPGFQRLVSDVGLGHVGIVLGVEMSRLARSGSDWQQLLELCAVSGTLLADLDGVYDPAEFNDRLLLGLKGTMSQAELHLIKQRMRGGLLAKAGRGELAIAVPVGYVRRSSGEVAFDPDERVQTVVRLVFDTFAELGTVNAVLQYLVEHGIELGVRVRQGPDKGEVEWRRPNRQTLQNMLHNPIYAGIYAFGRSRVDPRRHDPARPFTGRVRQDRSDWLVDLEQTMPAYLSVEQYEQNLARMQANRARADSMGTARDGPALLSGLVRCGRCGRRMAVCYQRGGAGALQPTYVCARDRIDYGASQCQQLSGTCVDAYVTVQVLSALAPAALELSLTAAEQFEADRARLDRIWQQRLERAAFDVDRARRCYRLAEPENRLVVRQLEKDWEAALAAQQQLTEDYHRFTRSQPRTLTAQERATIRALAADIPALWHASSTTTADRKQIIRAIVDAVTVEVIDNSERVRVIIGWAGGHHTHDEIVRPVARLEQLSYYPRLVDRVRALAAAGCSAAQIAERLNAEGLRPPKRSDRFGTQAVRDLLRRLGCHRPPPHRSSREPLEEHEWWLADLAHTVGMPPVTLFNWLQRGWVTGRKSPGTNRWILRADPAEVARLRQMHQRPHGYHTRRRWLDQDGGQQDHAANT
jgi:DNA invertase Pin-like site-specific DNA recombinase